MVMSFLVCHVKGLELSLSDKETAEQFENQLFLNHQRTEVTGELL